VLQDTSLTLILTQTLTLTLTLILTQNLTLSTDTKSVIHHSDHALGALVSLCSAISVNVIIRDRRRHLSVISVSVCLRINWVLCY